MLSVCVCLLFRSILCCAQGSWVSFVWNWFLIAMLLWFVKSIVESSVQERLADRDTETVEAAKQAIDAERSGVTTRLMEQRQNEAAAAAAAETSNSSKKKKSRKI